MNETKIDGIIRCHRCNTSLDFKLATPTLASSLLAAWLNHYCTRPEQTGTELPPKTP